MLSIIRALLASTLPVLVAARARVIGIHDIPAGRELDTTNSSIVWITAAPGDQILFEPPTASVNVGQVVNFVFPTNLPVSVTQSSFNDPCTYLNTSNETGFDSQLQQSIIFTLEILDQDPIYFHCKHPGHCGQGMVGALNPPTTGNETFTIFQNNAVGLGSNAPNDTNGATPVTGGGSGAVGSTVASTIVSATATSTTSDAQPVAMLRSRMWPAGTLLALVCLMMTA